MILVSKTPPDAEWILPTVTNSYEARLAGRKRGHDEACEEKQELTTMHARRSNKKTKVEGSFPDVLNTSNASNRCIDRAPHEVLAGASDWKFEPLQIVKESDLLAGDTPPPGPPVDVEKVITILLQAINASSQRAESPEPPARSHQHHPTSPLSNTCSRAPFVRKSVGGPCRGRTEPGLRRWVMCKNHVEDVRSSHPSLRSSEWIEALHEMGWEHLHPTYVLQSQQTTEVDAFPNPFDGWIDMDGPRSGGRAQTV